MYVLFFHVRCIIKHMRSSKDANNVKNDWKITILEQKSLYLNVATLEYLSQILPIDVNGITTSTLKIS